MQIVCEGKTMSGTRGLFTGGFLAMPLPKDWDAWTAAQRAAWCEQRGFKLT